MNESHYGTKTVQLASCSGFTKHAGSRQGKLRISQVSCALLDLPIFPQAVPAPGPPFFFSFSPAWRISGEHFQDTVWNQSLGSDILRIRFKDGICPRVEKAGTPGLERRARQGGNSAPNPAEVAAHVGSVCSPLWACGFLVSEKQKVDFLNVKSQVVFKTLGAAGAKRQTWLWLRSCVISGSWDQAPRQAPCSTYSLFEILSLSQINK